MATWSGTHVDPGWRNPAFEPTRNDNGYRRFDPTVYGAGLERMPHYAAAVPLWESYAVLKPGEPGYDNYQRFKSNLSKYWGVTDWTKATDKQLFDAMDATFRNVQSDNQKTNSFGDSVFGKVLGIAAPIAGSFFGPAGAALGGALGGGAVGGLKGAALGGLTGYVGAKYISPFVKNATSGVFGGGGYTLPSGGVAGNALNAALPGTFGAGTPYINAGSGALGLGAGLGAGALLSGASSAAGGKSVGLFDNFLSGLGNVAGSVAGDVIGGLIGRQGDSKAYDQALQAAQNSQLIVNPSPFQTNSLFLQTLPNGQNAVQQFGQKQINSISQLNDQAFSRAYGFDPTAFRDRLLEAANRVNDKRESQAFASLESKLFNQQGASTGTARQIADFKSDIEDRRYRRAVDSEVQTDAMRRGLLGDFAGTFGLLGNMDDRFRQQQQLSLVGAQALSPYGINNPAIANAGALRAQNTMDFFRGLGGTVGGIADTAISSLFSPNAGGGNAAPASGNPFAGVGPLQSYQNYSYLGV